MFNQTWPYPWSADDIDSFCARSVVEIRNDAHVSRGGGGREKIN